MERGVMGLTDRLTEFLERAGELLGPYCNRIQVGRGNGSLGFRKQFSDRYSERLRLLALRKDAVQIELVPRGPIETNAIKMSPY
jgi:hypothetical protein